MLYKNIYCMRKSGMYFIARVVPPVFLFLGFLWWGSLILYPLLDNIAAVNVITPLFVETNRGSLEQTVLQLYKKDALVNLFAPDDPVVDVLCYVIAHETKKIQVAMFMFTDATIAHALVEAKQRGVAVEVVGDRSGLLDRYNKFDYLYNEGISIYCYNAAWNGRKRNSIMHHKFVIFYDTLDHESLVWTGSFNFTKSAGQVNQENILICKRKEVVRQYQECFTRLVSRSYVYQSPFVAMTH